MKPTITVGITGGIGSGKSFICHILEQMGYPVFYADKVAKTLLAENAEIGEAIKNLLGDEAYLPNGVPNKPYIAAAIFNDGDKLKAMNAIVHPAVRKAFSDFAQQQESAMVFNEAAIIFETDSYKQFNKTILVTAPKALKLRRVLKRDQTTEADIEARMAKQWTDEQKMPLANYVIQNGENDMLLPQITDILTDILSN